MAPTAPPTPDALMEAGEATWPPATRRREGPWLIREGHGGGQRVSAASQADLAHPAREADIARGEAAMDALGQPRLFQLRPGEEALDGWLDTRGYALVDPVTIYMIRTKELAITAEKPPVGSVFATFPPLALMRELWADGEIGPRRIDVMQRACEPKTALFARQGDHAGGVAYLAVHAGIAMLHALHVPSDQRRKGVARALMREAGFWAQAQGADWLALYVTTANAPANALYASLGMQTAGAYHYRRKS